MQIGTITLCIDAAAVETYSQVLSDAEYAELAAMVLRAETPDELSGLLRVLVAGGLVCGLELAGKRLRRTISN